MAHASTPGLLRVGRPDCTHARLQKGGRIPKELQKELHELQAQQERQELEAWKSNDKCQERETADGGIDSSRPYLRNHREGGVGHQKAIFHSRIENNQERWTAVGIGSFRPYLRNHREGGGGHQKAVFPWRILYK